MFTVCPLGIVKAQAQVGSVSKLETIPTQSLRESFSARRNSLTENSQRIALIKQSRVTSAPPLRTVKPDINEGDGKAVKSAIERRRSFSARRKSYPSRTEMLKDIFTVFPTPRPQEVSMRRSRPSSAVALRAGTIPQLRQNNILWV